MRLCWRPCAVSQRPLNLHGALTQVEDISGKAECALEIPIMAVTSSSTSSPAPIAGHDKQPTTVTLLMSSSSSKHAPAASNASFHPPTIELGVAQAVNAGAGHRSDVHTNNVETVEAAVQDDALLVLDALESQGKGLEKENEWNSLEQRLVTFSAWPFSDNAHYPEVDNLRVVPSVTRLRVCLCLCFARGTEGKWGLGVGGFRCVSALNAHGVHSQAATLAAAGFVFTPTPASQDQVPLFRVSALIQRFWFRFRIYGFDADSMWVPMTHTPTHMNHTPTHTLPLPRSCASSATCAWRPGKALKTRTPCISWCVCLSIRNTYWY